MNLLIDSHSLLFRSHYALPPMNTRDGAPTSALYGFSVLLVKLLREHKPSALALAADTGAARERVARYPGYKAGRPPMPDPLPPQLRRLPEIAEAIGAPLHPAPLELEADDVLATAASMSAGRGGALVVSGDRDLLQVAEPGVDVLYIGQRGAKSHIRYDVDAVRNRYGVEPSQLPSITALVGDSSDNIPGLGGVGQKTAARWVSEYGDISGILAAIGELKPARLRPALEAAAENLRTWEILATLRRDLELAEPLAAPITRAALASLGRWFERLEFHSLVPRLEVIAEGLPS